MLRLMFAAVLLLEHVDRAGAEMFASERFGYTFAIPKGWRVAVPGSGVPVLFNYDDSESLPQGLIPDGGANIFLIPYEAVSQVSQARDLTAWIRANGEKWHKNMRTTRIASWSRDKSVPQEIVRVDGDYERAPEDPAFQAEINCYFVLHSSGFRLLML